MFDPNIDVIKRAVKKDEMRGLLRILWLFRDRLNTFDNTRVRLWGYCKSGNFREGFIFAKLRICEVSWKLNPREIAKPLSFTDIVKSCLSCEVWTSQICLLTLFTKIKFSRKISEFTVNIVWNNALMLPYTIIWTNLKLLLLIHFLLHFITINLHRLV